MIKLIIVKNIIHQLVVCYLHACSEFSEFLSSHHRIICCTPYSRSFGFSPCDTHMEFDAWCIRHHWNAVHTCRLSREYRTKKLSNCENHGDNPIINDRHSYRHTAYQIMPVSAVVYAFHAMHPLIVLNSIKRRFRGLYARHFCKIASVEVGRRESSSTRTELSEVVTKLQTPSSNV